LKVAIANLGCKANQYDGTYMAALLARHGYQLVDFKQRAEVYLINSCTVTDAADADSRNLIRRAHRRNPDAMVVVTGCYAQTRPEEVAKVEGVNLILGNNQKSDLLACLAAAKQEREKVHIKVEDIFRQKELETFGMSSTTDHTRAYVKIQDGCNQFCSFCIIPYARGRNRSVSVQKVIAELHELREQGFKEAILTGIHIGTYGQDLSPQCDLLDLLKRIEAERPIHRVRISSIDPEEISEAMVEFLSSSQVFCPHLHIPLQSGDDSTLKLMRRRYTRREFWDLSERLVQQIPNVCLGTDVMVGFPYEDEVRFQNTVELLTQTPLSYFHVFPYSAKQGTKAAQMLGQVAAEVKKQWAFRLRELSGIKKQAYREKFLGQEVEVILERRVNEPNSFETWSGFSENYLPVVVKTQKGQQGQLVRCHLAEYIGGHLAGKAH